MGVQTVVTEVEDGNLPSEEWSSAEAALVASFKNGRELDLSTADPILNDPFSEHAWGAERTVRAEVVAAIMLGGVEHVPTNSARLRLRGARISGQLDVGCGALVPFLLSNVGLTRHRS